MLTHGYLCDPDDVPFLRAEVAVAADADVAVTVVGPGFVTANLPATAPLPNPVFLRQFLPRIEPVTAASIRLWAAQVVERVRADCSPELPWRLHVAARYETLQSTHAGENRCALIAAAVAEILAKTARPLRRQLTAGKDPFRPGESLVQLVLTQPDSGWLSIAGPPDFAPVGLARRVSPFPLGEIPVASDPTAPSRAFAKLLEAEIRLGRAITAGESCVDLGACPGSWSYVALARGASVVAVDRAPVRADLLRNPRLRFHEGDAFKFAPERPVDWLICDVIATPERSIQVTLDWVRQRWCRHFIVSLKFKGHEEYALLDRLTQELPALTADFGLRRLCANKNEACGFGTVAGGAGRVGL